MSVDNTQSNVAYGLNQALLELASRPIVSRRNPTTRDKAAIGTQWVNRTANTSYVLVDIANNAAVWGLANTPVVGALNVGGALTCGGLFTVSVGGAAITGNSAITGTLVVSSTITATLGNITATAGSLVSTLGNVHAVNGNIYTDAGDIYTSNGNIEATQGNLNMVNGNVIFTHAATGVTLPGPTTIRTGAGAPANGLAVNAGDIYIRTDPAGAASRIYIATAANTWTNVTCAA